MHKNKTIKKLIQYLHVRYLDNVTVKSEIMWLKWSITNCPTYDLVQSTSYRWSSVEYTPRIRCTTLYMKQLIKSHCLVRAIRFIDYNSLHSYFIRHIRCISFRSTDSLKPSLTVYVIFIICIRNTRLVYSIRTQHWRFQWSNDSMPGLDETNAVEPYSSIIVVLYFQVGSLYSILREMYR